MKINKPQLPDNLMKVEDFTVIWNANKSIFVQTNFFRTKLRGFDFSECEMAQLVLSESLEEIGGAKISTLQALEVAQMLGVTITDTI